MRSTKVIHKDGNILVWCPYEQAYKPADQFYYWPNQRQKYSNYCKECTRVHKMLERGQVDNGLRPTEKKMLTEKQLAEELLTRLGYNLNDDIPVHKQFDIRHNL